MVMKNFISLSIMFFSYAAFYAQECDNIVDFGSTSFCMPNIAGYEEGYSNENVKQIADKGRYADNKILGFYLLSNDFELIRDGAAVTMKEYCKVYGTSETLDLDVDQKLYDKIEQYLTESFVISPELTKKGKDYFNYDELDIPITIEKYSLNDKSTTAVMLMNSTFDGVRITQITTISFFLVKNRILCLAYYVDYEGKDSITDAKKGNDLMLMLIQNSNK